MNPAPPVTRTRIRRAYPRTFSAGRGRRPRPRAARGAARRRARPRRARGRRRGRDGAEEDAGRDEGRAPRGRRRRPPRPRGRAATRPRAPRPASSATRTRPVVTAMPTATPASPSQARPTHSTPTWTSERPERQCGQPRSAAADEEEGEGDRDADRRDHPRRQVDDEPAELLAGAAAVGRAEHPARHRLAGEGEHAGCGRDRRERQPRSGDDVPGDALAVELAAGKRDAGDQRDRARRHRDEEGRDQVRVAEGRRVARAEPAREPIPDHVEALQRERQRHALGQRAEPRREPPGRGSGEAAARCERGDRDPHGDGAVQREPPAEGDDAVADERDDQPEPGDGADAERNGRRAVVVERSQRAGAETRVDLRRRRRHEPRQKRRGLRAGAPRPR